MPLDDWTAPALAQLDGTALRPGLLFRMASDPIVRIWNGLGDLAIPAGGVETDDGAIYRGIGELVGLPAVSQLINGVAERADFTLSGAAVSAEIAALASTDAAAVRGAEVNLGFMVFDAQWGRLSPICWLWAGAADVVGVNRDTDSGVALRQISLSVANAMSGRRRPGLAYFTDPDQRRRSPDDAFFDRVALYSVGTTKTWPA